MSAGVAGEGGRSTAIVTGAAQGIGAAEAEQLVASGRLVLLNDIDEEQLDLTVQRLGGPDVAVAVPGDISLSDTARALVAEATRGDRQLDVVVNNAGLVRNAPINEVSDDDFESLIAVNLRGTFYLCREAATYWRDRAHHAGVPVRSTLVSTTSRAALLANPTQAGYGAVKAGIAVIGQILGRELRGFGVRSNVIAPRAYTRMMWDVVGEFREDVLDDWDPAYIGRFVSFLAGPGGDDITGQVFVVHGRKISLVRTWETSDAVEVDYTAGDGAVLKRVQDLFAGEPTAISEFEVDDLPLADANAKPFRVEKVTPPPPTMT
jgi:NAD(P)-dependent dehydrogenase (short-subunit alcohol dehydrogenase family)